MAEEEKQHVLLFPFMAQGHIIPFLALALQLERREKYNITIVNTSLNIKKLRSSLPPNSSITLVEIPFNPSDHGLPPNTENTDTIPYNLVIRLIEASTTLKPAFRNLVRNILVQSKRQRRKLFIVADIFFGWTAAVAKEFAVFHAIFSGCGGFGLACYYSLWQNLPHRRVESTRDHITLPDFPQARDIHRTQLPNNISQADGTDAWSLFQRKNLSEWVDSDGVVFNTVHEFDSVGLGYFKRKLGRPAWAIGPILFTTGSGSRGKGGGINPKLCTEWLDAKPSKSVLFVCFGSMNTISASQMMELGNALERCGKSFLWVVRPPIGFDINSEFREEWLPEGFAERVRESGKSLIVHDWAPQVEILSHGAVSAFLSHCGWNSVLESLSRGVPILGWPMAAEQFYNCKLLEEEVGVCVEVARGKNCEVKYEDIVGKIELVMNETEKGAMMRKKAGEIRVMIREAVKDEDGVKGSSVRAMDEFLSAADS